MMRKYLIVCLFLLSTACASAQIITGSFLFNGYTRAYDLHLPAGWTSANRYPLVLDYHYLGADGRDEDSLTRFNAIADTAGFIVCHPYGSGTDWEVGQSVPYHNGPSDVDFTSALIDTLDAHFGVDLSRVYATGMGQGGFMVQRLACELGDRIAAFASVGASIADSAAYYCQYSRPIPMMIIHGTADSVIEYNQGLSGIWRDIPSLIGFWRGRDTCGTAVDSTTLPDLVPEGSTIKTYRWTCASGSEVLHYKVIDGGFAWPGANRDLGSGGLRNMDINASEHIWQFFRRFSLDLVLEAAAAQPQAQFELYPQPAQDELQLQLAQPRNVNIRCLGMDGREVAISAQKTGATAYRIDVRGLPSGIYLLQVGDVARRMMIRH